MQMLLLNYLTALNGNLREGTPEGGNSRRMCKYNTNSILIWLSLQDQIIKAQSAAADAFLTQRITTSPLCDLRPHIEQI